jgi:hypothetical protein
MYLMKSVIDGYMCVCRYIYIYVINACYMIDG